MGHLRRLLGGGLVTMDEDMAADYWLEAYYEDRYLAEGDPMDYPYDEDLDEPPPEDEYYL